MRARFGFTVGVNLVLAGALAVVAASGLLGSDPHPATAAATTVTRHTSTTPPRETTVVATTPPTHPVTTARPTTVPATVATVPPLSRPSATYPTYPSYTYVTYPTVTTVPVTTTSTTIAPLGGRIPVVPSTLPLTTRSSSAHVSPVFAALSGGGFFVALCIVTFQWIRTRPRRSRPG